MAERENLTDFFMKLLDGIGYGKLSKTNRAYSWMKNNNTFEGPCLNFLKDNISEENLITVEEMNQFIELEKKGNLPSEDEIDQVLSEYLGDTTTHFEYINLKSLQNEASQALKYYEALELEEKLLKRQCNKIQEDINSLESQTIFHSNERETILAEATKTNILYNNTVKEIQDDLSKIWQFFSTLLTDSDAVEEQNLFRMNFETLKEINNTFREAVNTAIQKQFNRPKEDDTDVSQVEALISVAQSLGQYNYQRLKLQCEEKELEELNDYIENVLKNFDFGNINISRMKSETDINIDITCQIQKKILNLSEFLEKFHSDYVINKMLMDYRSQLEHNLKGDYKFLKKISDLCSKFVDVMTLQACLAQKEKDNVDWIIASYDYAREKLEEHLKKHTMTVMNLKKVMTDRESLEICNQSSNFSMDSGICNSSINLSDSGDVNSLQTKILSFIGNRLDEFYMVKEQLNELDRITFSGPLRQIFFHNSLQNEKTLLKQQYENFRKQYQSWKSQYNEQMEKTNVNELDKLQKSLGLLFLTDPTALQDNYKQLKTKILQNRSKFSNSVTTPSTEANSSQLQLKKVNFSYAL